MQGVLNGVSFIRERLWVLLHATTCENVRLPSLGSYYCFDGMEVLYDMRSISGVVKENKNLNIDGIPFALFMSSVRWK